MEKVIFRCSSLGRICTGASLVPVPLTEKQSIELKELQSKDSKSQKRFELEKKLTEVPKAELSTGAKTYIRDVWYGNTFDFQKTFHNKFVEKGNDVEHRSIAVLTKYLGVFGRKNEEHLTNDWVKGTPDIRLNKPKCTIDAKNVYYPNGLQFFDDEKEKSLYEWQIHGYNFLDEKDTGFVARILMNPTESILEKEVWNYWKSGGNDGIPTESFVDEVRDLFDFEGKKSIEDRVSIFQVKTTQHEIDCIKKWTELANNYYQELNEEYNLNKKRFLDYFVKQ
jgi:hypothetical protein